MKRTSLDPQQRQALRRQCRQVLPGFAALSPADEFEALAQWARREDAQADVYGEGGLVGRIEQRVAELLDKPAAAFMPSGVMAQLIAMRIYTERAGLARFGQSPNSHLALHEQEAAQSLWGLHAAPVGTSLQPMRAEDLAAVRQPLAAVMVELPMREAGGQLPDWDALHALKAQAAAMRTPLHMDGARLWQCRAFYQRSLAEIAKGFESVYVSMYKDIGGIAGAVLAGEPDFIANARIWQRRMGGNLYQQTPFAASALMRLDERMGLLDACCQRALALAAVFESLDGVRVNPARPQVNMFHLHIDAPADALNDARDDVAREHGCWLFGAARPMATRGWSVIELTVGDNLLAIDDAQVRRLFGDLLARARSMD